MRDMFQSYFIKFCSKILINKKRLNIKNSIFNKIYLIIQTFFINLISYITISPKLEISI
jgi:hypothetical protein